MQPIDDYARQLAAAATRPLQLRSALARTGTSEIRAVDRLIGDQLKPIAYTSIHYQRAKALQAISADRAALSRALAALSEADQAAINALLGFVQALAAGLERNRQQAAPAPAGRAQPTNRREKSAA